MITQRYGAILAVAAAVVLVGMATSSLATTWDVQPFGGTLGVVNTSANEVFPVWSPDGERLAYISSPSPNVRELYIANADGTETWQITTDVSTDVGYEPNGVYEAVWSPDSQYLLYTQGLSTPKHIVKIKLNTARTAADDRAVLTTETYAVTWRNARFSPDGTKITANMLYGSTSYAYLMNADGSGLQFLNNNTYGQVPAYSPDGSLIAYSLSGSASNVSSIYGATSSPVGTNLNIRALAWSPDGSAIAFSRPNEPNSYLGLVDNLDGAEFGGPKLFVLDGVATTCAHQIYAGQEDVWSADGSQLVYSRLEELVPNLPKWNVYTISYTIDYTTDPNGVLTREVELVAASGGNDVRARFFGNGRICFQSERDYQTNGWDIYIAIPPNRPPVADANGPYITLPEEGALVMLNGSASDDPDGDPLSYSWKIGELEIGTAPSFQWLFPIGLTEVTLTVTDPQGASDTDETEVMVTAREVAIDIKPGDDQNTINLGSHGALRVAFLTDEDFDAATIDPLTVTLAGRGFSGLIKMRGKKNPQPMASFEDIDEDGDLDLVVHLEIENLALEPTAAVCMLGALTTDGWVVQGQDTVNIVGQ
jgi:Tol biopolymer transport system component